MRSDEMFYKIITSISFSDSFIEYNIYKYYILVWPRYRNFPVICHDNIK